MVTNSKIHNNTVYNPQNNDKENLITWISGDRNIKKQLDYITISQKHKNGLRMRKQKE